MEDVDRPRLDALLREHWGGEPTIVRGVEHHLLQLPGLIAGDRDGVACDRVPEPLLLHALRKGDGIGTAPVDASIGVLRRAGHDRLLVTTTNDNLAALGFYQRRGFRLHAIRCGAVDETRLRKPAIPLIGFNRSRCTTIWICSCILKMPCVWHTVNLSSMHESKEVSRLVYERLR